MYTTYNDITAQDFKQLQVQRMLKTPSFEMLSISLEAGGVFPEHTAPSDAVLLLLEGEINFYTNGHEYKLSRYQVFDFPKETPHWVKAVKNSKFLIIR
jgi:quercetin dioxygenase-like cupin family protein